MASNVREALSLYVATNRDLAGPRDVCDLVGAALRGGATAVQLRDKTGTTREIVALGYCLRLLTRQAGALFIVNDRVDLALALRADGVHLGQQDLPVRLARQIMGPSAIIGVSTNQPVEAQQAEQDGADYVGVGPAFSTATKANPRPVLGAAGIAAVRAATRLPLVAIGGITLSGVAAMRAAGADGICVIGAVFGAGNPEDAARALITEWKKAEQDHES
jgi:thiamine-phosphate pyrophosphorylase